MTAAPHSIDQLRPSRNLPELEVQAGVENKDVACVVGGADGTGWAEVPQFFVHVHQVGLHDEPRSQSVGHAATICLIVAGIGGGGYSGSADRWAALITLSLGVGHAHRKRSSRIAGAQVPCAAVAGSIRGPANFVEISAVVVTATDFEAGVAHLGTRLPSPEILKGKSGERSILTS